MIWLAFLLGFIVGAMATCAACAWWAFSAMGDELPCAQVIHFEPSGEPVFRMVDADELARRINNL